LFFVFFRNFIPGCSHHIDCSHSVLWHLTSMTLSHMPNVSHGLDHMVSIKWETIKQLWKYM
jgi:hypothetical protein